MESGRRGQPDVSDGQTQRTRPARAISYSLSEGRSYEGERPIEPEGAITRLHAAETAWLRGHRNGEPTGIAALHQAEVDWLRGGTRSLSGEDNSVDNAVPGDTLGRYQR